MFLLRRPCRTALLPSFFHLQCHARAPACIVSTADDLFAKIVDDHIEKQAAAVKIRMRVPAADQAQTAAGTALEKESLEGVAPQVDGVMRELFRGLSVKEPGEIGGRQHEKLFRKQATGAKTEHFGSPVSSIQKRSKTRWCNKHDRRISRCKECAPPRYWCPHKRLRFYCSVCRPQMKAKAKRKRQRLRELCSHGKKMHLCIPCGGAGVCSHGKVRKHCPECFDSSSVLGCRHGLRQDYCAICAGNGLCQHLRIPQRCDQCGFRKRCPHGAYCRYRCRICRPEFSELCCPHSEDRRNCRGCRSTPLMCRCGAPRLNCTKGCPHPLLCEHNKMQFQCGICRWCKHNVKLSECITCRSACLCPHGNVRSACKQCIVRCPHGKVRRSKCKECCRCSHGERKSMCELCRVSAKSRLVGKNSGDRPCEHGVIRRYCLLCAQCKHKMLKSKCAICSSSVMISGQRIRYPTCIHGKQKKRCWLCCGCKHNVKKSECAICRPRPTEEYSEGKNPQA